MSSAHLQPPYRKLNRMNRGMLNAEFGPSFSLPPELSCQLKSFTDKILFTNEMHVMVGAGVLPEEAMPPIC